jgi:hypothetical protein
MNYVHSLKEHELNHFKFKIRATDSERCGDRSGLRPTQALRAVFSTFGARVRRLADRSVWPGSLDWRHPLR